MKYELDRYVIVCLLNGEALSFHEKITKEVCDLFNVKRQRLPAHFTIKAPFEHNDISEIEKITEEFCNTSSSSSITLNGYNHFRDSVVYMDIHVSKKALEVHNNYINALKNVRWLKWKRNENSSKTFHCTIVSKLKPEKFTDVWNYVIKHPYSFQTSFDNISILKWTDYRWEIYKQYIFKNKEG